MINKILVSLIIILINIPVFVHGEISSDSDIRIDVNIRYETVNQQVAEFNTSGNTANIYAYLQTEQEYKENKDFENITWAFFIVSGFQYDVNHVDVLPNTKYYYRVVEKNGQIIKESSFKTFEPYDKSLYPDFSVVKDYLEIDYLEGDEYKKARELGSYAAIRFKYQDRLIFDNEKKIVRVAIKNNANNKILITMFGLWGHWPDYEYGKGPYLTKDEFNCFFRNGENLITVTIEAEDPIEEVNKNNNQFTKLLDLSGIEEVPEDICNVSGKIFSPKMRIDESSIQITIEKGPEKTFIITNKTGRKVIVETEEDVEINENKLYLNENEVKIMPDTASETAINRLKLLNFTIELKDVGKPIYEVEGEKQVKLFGFIKSTMKIKTQISAETGEIEKIEKPWWSFLATEILPPKTKVKIEDSVGIEKGVQEETQKITPMYIRLEATTLAAPFDPLKEEPNIPSELTTTQPNGYYLVQFKGTIKEEWKSGVQENGGKLHGFIHDNAYIVGMTKDVENKIKTLTFVRWVGIYQPAYKIEPGYWAEIKGKSDIDEIFIQIFNEEDTNFVADQVEKLGGEIIDKSNQRIRSKITKDKIKDIAFIGDVEWIEEYIEPTLS